MDIFRLIGSIFIKNDDANKSIDTTADKAKDAGTTIGSAMQKAGQKVTDLGKKLTPLSVAAGALLTASVKGASDFTDGMSKMSTLFDTTQTSVSDLSQQFLDLSNKTGISATELAEAGYQALSAGQSVDQVAGFVETAGNLAKAGFTTASTSVDVLTTAINAYGDSAGSADEIANKLVRTQNLGKTTVDELASSMGKIIPTASSMGVNIDNLTSGYVSLTKQGIATAESTTYLNSMLNELGDSGTDLGGIIKDQTGKSFQDLMNEGYSLADVLQITKKYADENGIAYNELWSSAEAGKAGLAILNGGVKEFNDTVDVMKDKTDEVGTALEKLDTPSMKVQKSMNRVKNSGIQLGTTLLTALAPTIDKIASGIEKATTWFNNLDPSVQTTIGAVLGFITVLAPVLIIGGKIIAGIGAVIGVIGPLLGTIGAVIGSIHSVSGLMVVLGAIITGPVGIIAGITALIGAGIYLMTHWDQVKQKASEIKDKVVDAWNNLKQKTAEAWTNLKDKAVQKAQELKASAVNKFNELKTNAVNKFNELKTNATSKFEEVKSKVTSKIDGLKENVKSRIESIKGFFTGISPSTLAQKFSDAKDRVTEKINSMKDKVKEAIDRIKGFFNVTLPTPKLKLPHLSISGSLSLAPPSVPKLSVSWYKKAMEDPFLLQKPTVFGMNPITGSLKAGGEAGDEMIYGRTNLMQDIAQVTSAQNQQIIDRLESMFTGLMDLLMQYFPEFRKPIPLDIQHFVDRTADDFDQKFGRMEVYAGRGI